MKECSIKKCGYEAYENDKCIFHCEKVSWFKTNSKGERKWNENKVRKFWEEIRKKIKENETEIWFIEMIFPISEFFFILKNNPSSIDIDFAEAVHISKNLYFENCIFEYELSFRYCEEIDGLSFSNCNVKECITIERSTIISFIDFDEECEINNITCNDVTIKGEVLFKNVTVRELYFNNSTFENKIEFNNVKFKKNINIKNSEFKNEIQFNNINVKKQICFYETSFQYHTSFMNSKNNKAINKLVFDGTEFGENADIYFYNLDIKNLEFIHLRNYAQYVTFVDIKIVDEQKKSKIKLVNSNVSSFEFIGCDFSESEIEIKNVSFKSNNGFTIFNDVKWGKIKETFSENTKRDTFRQLKYANEQQGNIIDANRFYSAEMNAYRKELKNTNWNKHIQDKIIFNLNRGVSNFSQSWISPLGWFLTIGLIFYFISKNNNIRLFELIGVSIFSISLVLYFDIIFLIEDCNCKVNKFFWCLFITSIFTFIYFFNLSSYLNDFLEFINPIPFSNSINEYPPLIWIVFKALSTFIIYQFIVSLRRQTRR